MNGPHARPARAIDPRSPAGLVERVTYHNAENGFCVLRASARGHRETVTVVGHTATSSAAEWITASGELVNDRTHGQQFKARFLRTSPSTSADGIEKYLASGMIRGVGPVYMKENADLRELVTRLTELAIKNVLEDCSGLATLALPKG
jgi:exodeoxyribonuclease V alpha subunit